MCSLVEKCHTLQAVDSSCTKVLDEGIRSFAEKCHALQTVGLSGNKVLDEGICGLAEQCHTLQAVDLSCTKVSDESIRCACALASAALDPAKQALFVLFLFVFLLTRIHSQGSR